MKTKEKWRVYNYMSDEMLKQAINLDNEVFDDIDLVEYKMCKEWLSVNDQIYTVLTYNDKLAGYINFVPLTHGCYEKFKTGKYKDYHLKKEDIVPFKEREDHECLFLSICINPELRDGCAIKKLWKAFVTKIKNFEKKGIHISKIIEDCVSFDGIKIALYNLNSKYICDSVNGKIYESKFLTNRKKAKLRYVPINKSNLKTASKIQYEIFKESNWVGYCDYLDEVKLREKKHNENMLPINFLVYRRKTPIGVVGLYEDPKYRNDIFMDWLGVLPKYRYRGYGTQMLFFVFEYARKVYKRSYFRLITYKKMYIEANSIYRKTMQLVERYNNELEDIEWVKKAEPRVYSSSMIDKRPIPWGNRYINLQAEIELNKRSIEKLKEDNLI